MKRRPGQQDDRRRQHRNLEQRLLPDLAALRATLLEESGRVRRDRGRRHGREEEHLCCRRPNNQMRISPLEARAIAEVFREDPALRAKLPDVLKRLAAEVPLLKDDGKRQSFDCPLLDGDRCLVHRLAKPIGCLAWHSGKEYSKKGWNAFEVRDELNDSIYGHNWQLRVIPLWLKRVFRQQLRPYLSAPRSSPRADAPKGETTLPPPHSPPKGGTVARPEEPDRRKKPFPRRAARRKSTSNSTRHAL